MAGKVKYRILYEDQDVIVVWKAAGVPVQSARPSVPDVMSMLRNRELEQTGSTSPLYLVNRLDQPVEGIFLVAKSEKSAADLNRQIQAKSSGSSGNSDIFHMEKIYRALVCGKLPASEGTLVDYLVKDGRANTSRVVPKGAGDGKRSELHYRVLKEWEDQTLLEIRLMTGRHHQIRVQLAHAGHPIVGDTKYGASAARVFVSGVSVAGAPAGNGAEDKTAADHPDAQAVRQLCLCSFKTAFLHPRTRKRMSFQEEPSFPVPPTTP